MNPEEIAPQVKVGLNPHVGLTQGCEGRDMQDPRGGQMMQLKERKNRLDGMTNSHL
jgi:hypothetical protein